MSGILSEPPSPAKASSHATNRAKGFAQTGNRYPPRIKCGASFFAIMLEDHSDNADQVTARIDNKIPGKHSYYR